MTHPIPTAALDDRLGFTGTSGSGKTYAAGTAVERLLTKKQRVVIVDPLDVWWGLRLMADGKTASPYNVVIFGGRHGDLPLTEHSGALIGETVAGMSESCVVSLGGFTTGASERRFMLGFLQALYRHTDKVDPFHVVFDEADMWAPQKVMDKEGDANKLLGMMETVVRRGRVKGFIPWLITQRPAVLSKNVLSQVDGLIAMKLTSSQDRDAIGDWVKGQADIGKWTEIRGELATLLRGHGLVWVPGRGVLEVVGFPTKITFDSSRTPKRGEVQRKTELQPVDLTALRGRLSTVEAEVKANDPKVLKAEIATLKRQMTQAVTQAVLPDPQAIEKARAEGRAEGERAAAESFIVLMRERYQLIGTAVHKVQADLADMVNAFGKEVEPPKLTYKSTPRAAPPPPRLASIPRETAAHSKGNGSARAMSGPGDAAVGSGGLRRILIALAQCPGGLTNRQIGVRATLSSKSGTFSTYLSRARSQGWIEGAGTLRITESGLEALGAYDPLPSGPDLLAYWLRELGGGAGRILQVVAEAYPQSLSNAEVGERANLASGSGTFSTYLSRLRTLELITGRGELRASEDLFA